MANSGLNSFAENMRIVMTNQSNQLSLLTAMQKSMVENNVYSTYEWSDVDNTYHEFQLPTFASLQNRISNIEHSLESLLTGRGSISSDNDNRYHVTINTVPQAPDNITYLQDPTIFYADPNWLFENYMFPAAKVRILLTGQVDDKCRQIHYKRVIVDSTGTTAQLLWNNRLQDRRYTYPELINILIDEGVNYYEDTQTVFLPHARNSYWGVFQIIDDPQYEKNLAWYTFDTLNYQSIDRNGTNQGDNNLLKVGDNLLYNNALFQILEIRQDTNQVRMKCVNGVAIPGNGSMMRYYNDATSTKYVDIRFGANEYNFIYLKAVGAENNILSNAWSQCIKFDSNNLDYYDINDENQNIKFSQFYGNNVYDWGAELLAKVKEKHIPAYMAVTPANPVLDEENFKVTAINTHINSAADEKKLSANISEIETSKSNIDSLTATINNLRLKLSKSTSLAEYKTVQDNIAENLKNLQTAQAAHSTLVTNVKSNLTLNSAFIDVKPKYRIRGFFSMPAPAYYDNAMTREQEVIGFDIAYRYLTANKTANTLDTYVYTDSDNSKLTAVFSDWIETQSKIKERKFNKEKDAFEWITEPAADGTVININQIDIPISQGESVEFKVRSITEAGYPENPVKSGWSNSVIIEFPAALKVKNTFADAVENIKFDATNVQFRNLMQQEGLIYHMQDAIINADGTTENFVHKSENIAYTDIAGDNVKIVSLQSKIDAMEKRLLAVESNYTNTIKTIKDVNLTLKSTNAQLSKLDPSATFINPNISTNISTNTPQVSTNNSTVLQAELSEVNRDAHAQSSDSSSEVFKSSGTIQSWVPSAFTAEMRAAYVDMSGKLDNLIGNAPRDPNAIPVNSSLIPTTSVPLNSSLFGTTATKFSNTGILQQFLGNKYTIGNFINTGEIHNAIYNEEYVRRTLVPINALSKTDKDFEDLKNALEEVQAKYNILLEKYNELETKLETTTK